VEWAREKWHGARTSCMNTCCSMCEAFAFENLGVFSFLGDGKLKSVLILLYDECLAQKLNTLMPKLTSLLHLDEVCFYL
jgi:hypothetical protein